MNNDVMDIITEISDETGVVAQYEYDANSQLIENTRNGITTTYDYNELGQLTELVNSDINSELQTFTYQYDAIGNIVEEVRVEGNETNNRTYQYDSANQLVEFKDNDYTETYLYDKVGNMLVKDVNSELTEYAYNEANQLVEEVTNGQTIGYTYNANGDLTNKTTGEQYSYDIQGNLTAIVGNGIDKQYTYNGVGNRLSETTDGETILYVNDLNRRYEEVLQTYNEDGNVINTYTYGVDRIQSVGENTETYLYDGRGSVVGSVSDDVMTCYAYTAYGELMPESAVPNVYGYNAEATDFTTGIQYLRARYYDTTVARFFQEDDYRGDFVESQTLNRYIYVGSNPVMGVDPSGYWENPLKKIGSAVSNTVNKVVDGVKKAISTTKERVSNAIEIARINKKGQEYMDYYTGGYNQPADWPDEERSVFGYPPVQNPESSNDENDDYTCYDDIPEYGIIFDEGGYSKLPWMDTLYPGYEEFRKEVNEAYWNSIEPAEKMYLDWTSRVTNSSVLEIIDKVEFDPQLRNENLKPVTEYEIIETGDDRVSDPYSGYKFQDNHIAPYLDSKPSDDLIVEGIKYGMSLVPFLSDAIGAYDFVKSAGEIAAAEVEEDERASFLYNGTYTVLSVTHTYYIWSDSLFAKEERTTKAVFLMTEDGYIYSDNGSLIGIDANAIFASCTSDTTTMIIDPIIEDKGYELFDYTPVGGEGD